MFTKDFWKLLVGFIAILVVGFVSLYFVGAYKLKAEYENQDLSATKNKEF